MDLKRLLGKLFIDHTELGREREQMIHSLQDLSTKIDKVQETIDIAVNKFQKFALDVKKDRTPPTKSRSVHTAPVPRSKAKPQAKKVL